MAGGGVFTLGTDTSGTQFTDEARAAGLPISAHAHALAAVWPAVRAGPDHGALEFPGADRATF